jgi:hypothetical protein
MKRNGLQPKIVGAFHNWCRLPSRAISIHRFTNEQIITQIEALFG